MSGVVVLIFNLEGLDDIILSYCAIYFSRNLIVSSRSKSSEIMVITNLRHLLVKFKKSVNSLSLINTDISRTLVSSFK